MHPPFGFGQPTLTAMAISGDSRFIVYSARQETSQGKPQLYLRRADELEAKPISGTEGGISPFLSPDDHWVGFWADDKLVKVSIDGGVPVTLTETEGTGTASWGPGNNIVYAVHPKGHISRISADGGSPHVLTTPDESRSENGHQLPHWLPDGKGVLFTVLSDEFDQKPRVAVLDLMTLKWRVLVEDAADARYVPTGHVIFLRHGTLMAAPFDLQHQQITGQPVAAVSNVMQALNTSPSNTAAGQFGISDSGTLIYALGGTNPDREDQLVWVDLRGSVQPVVSFKAPFWAPRLSPDGQRIAYVTGGKEWRTWIHDLNRGTAMQLTNEGKTDFPIWTSDGKRVAFKWWSSGEPSIYWQPVDGSSDKERLTTSNSYQVPGSFSPDGSTLAFVEKHQETGWDIYLLDLKSRRVTPLLNSKADEAYPEISPDGHWLAYVSNESGREEVYVRPFPEPGGRTQVSATGGEAPAWSRDGKQLFFLSNDGFWITDVRANPTFSSSRPRLLFKQLDYLYGFPSRTWDVSLDGQHFLIVKPADRKSKPVTELILVQDWFDDLKHLIPNR